MGTAAEGLPRPAWKSSIEPETDHREALAFHVVSHGFIHRSTESSKHCQSSFLALGSGTLLTLCSRLTPGSVLTPGLCSGVTPLHSGITPRRTQKPCRVPEIKPHKVPSMCPRQRCCSCRP